MVVRRGEGTGVRESIEEREQRKDSLSMSKAEVEEVQHRETGKRK